MASHGISQRVGRQVSYGKRSRPRRKTIEKIINSKNMPRCIEAGKIGTLIGSNSSNTNEPQNKTNTRIHVSRSIGATCPQDVSGLAHSYMKHRIQMLFLSWHMATVHTIKQTSFLASSQEMRKQGEYQREKWSKKFEETDMVLLNNSLRRWPPWIKQLLFFQKE